MSSSRVSTHRAGSLAPETFLPLGVPTLRILLALGDDRLHGYAMLQRLEQESGGRDAMLPGTLYSTLAKMLDAGLVEEVASERRDDDARRRYYQVTPFGQEVARAEALRLERLVTLARKRKLLPAVGGEEGG